MRFLILASALLAISWAENPKDDVQLMNIKSVKGGYSYPYKGDQNYNRFYNNSQSQHGYSAYGQVNHTTVNHEVGVCYIEVPTATLVRDPKHVPAGNGSRSDLSRIRTCCAGYIRNIHNYHICDPVCTKDCINALCTAPDTCTCFPDHVKNLAGFCVATCPIGCQNGHCSGRQCLCKEGFKLDVNGRFCVPHCRDNCGGIGNCTAPNTCACQPGYASTPDGSCRPGAPGSYPQPGPHGSYPQPGTVNGSQPCGTCINGYCMGTECRCRPGYLIYKGECIALCNPNCGPNADCVSPNVCVAKSAPGGNATQTRGISTYPNNPQYPYSHSTQNTTYQNPAQYPYGQYPNQNQHPYPNNQNPQYRGDIPQNNTYPYPNPSNQYPGTHPGPYPGPAGQQNQYPNQPSGYPHQSYPNQPNGTHQYPYQPGHQHLYPDLPSNTYPNPQINHGRPNGTDGQVYYQNRPYNPLENVTYNLQQGGSDQDLVQGQNGTQGQYGGGQYPQGHYGQGQYNQGQHSQGQFNHGQTSQGQYDQGQYEQGQYGQGQHNQGQYGQGQHNQGQYGQGQQNQGQYGQGQHNQGQYGQGQQSQGQYGQGQQNQGYYGQGQYSQGQYNQSGYAQGQYSQGQYNQSGYIQGQYSQGQNPYGQPVTYDLSVPGAQPGSQMTVQGLGAPQCEHPCLNGNCVGANTCECFPGYNLDPTDTTGTRCIPYCPGGCPNGYCSAPYSCTCNVGYQKDFSVKGRSGCIRRARRSAEDKPVDVSDLLVFEIPDY